MTIFRQLFDPHSSTYTYLLADPETHEAVLIDPVFERAERELELLRQLELRLVYALDTHVHADHVTAATRLRDATGARTVASWPGAPCADLRVNDGDTIRFGQLALRVLATPGHTDDSVSYLLIDPRATTRASYRVFTGDALLIRATGRTDFQNGDASRLYDSITKTLFLLPDATRVKGIASFDPFPIGGRAYFNRGETVLARTIADGTAPTPKTAITRHRTCVLVTVGDGDEPYVGGYQRRLAPQDHIAEPQPPPSVAAPAPKRASGVDGAGIVRPRADELPVAAWAHAHGQ